jgi:hypothetical protein
VWRFSGAAFCDLTQVAPAIKDMKKDGFKPSIGLGIRFALNEKERVKIRADLAWVDKGIGFIIDVREAF